MTWARRKDASHQVIAEALEAAGIVVLDTSRLGDGFPDVLCYDPQQQVWLPIELKTRRYVRHYKTFNPENAFTPQQLARRALVPIPSAETPAQALALFGRSLP